MLGITLLLGGCGRTLRSCAAYVIILGPTTMTLTCPPPGFAGSEDDPGAVIIKEK
jgi:hypothetical protein